MGCDWYITHSCIIYGILLRWQDIKERWNEEKEGKKKSGTIEAAPEAKKQKTDGSENENVECLRWVSSTLNMVKREKKNCPRFHAWRISDGEILTTGEEKWVFLTPEPASRMDFKNVHDLVGPYVIESEKLSFFLRDICSHSEDDFLTSLAMELLPSSRVLESAEKGPLGVLSFPPANYVFSCSSYVDNFFIISEYDLETFDFLPKDCELIVSKESQQQTFQVNRAFLACGSSAWKALLYSSQDVDAAPPHTVTLPDLDPRAVDKLLRGLHARVKRYASSESEDLICKSEEMVAGLLPSQRTIDDASPSSSSLALDDPDLMDCTFLVGPEKVPIQACKPFLAATNDVLKNILYGSEHLSGTVKPVVWPDFEPDAVKSVFLALVTGKGSEISLDQVRSARIVADYLGETLETLDVSVTGFSEVTTIELTRRDDEEEIDFPIIDEDNCVSHVS